MFSIRRYFTFSAPCKNDNRFSIFFLYETLCTMYIKLSSSFLFIYINRYNIIHKLHKFRDAFFIPSNVLRNVIDVATAMLRKICQCLYRILSSLRKRDAFRMHCRAEDFCEESHERKSELAVVSTVTGRVRLALKLPGSLTGAVVVTHQHHVPTVAFAGCGRVCAWELLKAERIRREKTVAVKKGTEARCHRSFGRMLRTFLSRECAFG